MTLEYRDEAGLVGYAILMPKQSSVAQLAVRKDRRREGIATTLLSEATKRTGVELWRVINVDRNSSDMRAFLAARNAEATLSQKELMIGL